MGWLEGLAGVLVGESELLGGGVSDDVFLYGADLGDGEGK